ncbi:hypothetical protein CI102_8467 [Trichoderma harzianum]|nr:hypothetical protein CI102_8467 [Trichoderma harzianum]
MPKTQARSRLFGCLSFLTTLAPGSIHTWHSIGSNRYLGLNVQRTRCYMYLLHPLPAPWIDRPVAFVASPCFYSCTCSCTCSYSCFSFLRVPGISSHPSYLVQHRADPIPLCLCLSLFLCLCLFLLRTWSLLYQLLSTW